MQSISKHLSFGFFSASSHRCERLLHTRTLKIKSFSIILYKENQNKKAWSQTRKPKITQLPENSMIVILHLLFVFPIHDT